jgi:hypothetical protein
MNKKQAITALENGSVMIYYSPPITTIMGLSARAWINDEMVSIAIARELMRTILKMDEHVAGISCWSIAIVAHGTSRNGIK